MTASNASPSKMEISMVVVRTTTQAITPIMQSKRGSHIPVTSERKMTTHPSQPPEIDNYSSAIHQQGPLTALSCRPVPTHTHPWVRSLTYRSRNSLDRSSIEGPSEIFEPIEQGEQSTRLAFSNTSQVRLDSTRALLKSRLAKPGDRVVWEHLRISESGQVTWNTPTVAPLDSRRDKGAETVATLYGTIHRVLECTIHLHHVTFEPYKI
jgi:hypothetical protein